MGTIELLLRRPFNNNNSYDQHERIENPLLLFINDRRDELPVRY